MKCRVLHWPQKWHWKITSELPTEIKREEVRTGFYRYMETVWLYGEMGGIAKNEVVSRPILGREFFVYYRGCIMKNY